MVGESLSGNVALELQKNHPEFKPTHDTAPIVDVAFRPNPNTDRYRANWESYLHVKYITNKKPYDQPGLTHQYQNNAKQL